MIDHVAVQLQLATEKNLDRLRQLARNIIGEIRDQYERGKPLGIEVDDQLLGLASSIQTEPDIEKLRELATALYRGLQKLEYQIHAKSGKP
jgi:hypothetical protein